MGLPKKLAATLHEKVTRLHNKILKINTIAALDKINIKQEVELASFSVPSLKLDKRKPESVSQTIRNDYPVPAGMPITMGKLYEGIQVTIPVVGYDLEQALPYLEQNQGFVIGPQLIIVTRFALNGSIENAKAQVKSFVEEIEQDLTALSQDIQKHEQILEDKIKSWISERKEQIKSKEDKDKNADPWG